MTSYPVDFSKQKIIQVTPLTELPAAVVKNLPDLAMQDVIQFGWDKPNPICIITKNKSSIRCDKSGGHYFMGGLVALMQAVRMLQQNPAALVTYVHDGQLKKSSQSAHQGHVHPTEWTTPECRATNLARLLLNSLHILPPAPPVDVLNYSYLHFPLSKIKLSLFARFFVHRVVHTLYSKNGVSEDDRWQCDAVRASLAFHKELSDEIEATGAAPTFAQGWRIMWSPHKGSIDKRNALWNELGIQTEFMSEEEIRAHTLFKVGSPIYALKVFGDGKFFPDVDGRITAFLSKKYPNAFQARTARVAEVYIDESTEEPFAVLEVLADGTCQTVAVDSFFGSTGHNQVFKVDPATQKKKALWQEVPVTGVSTLWVCRIAKSELLSRFGDISDDALSTHLKQLAGTANHTNLHLTIWDAIIDNDMVYIIARATQGANFNSELADPNDLLNMTANLNRFLIGNWRLISAGSCTRKTAISNVPEFKDHFLHGLSGIGFSFSGVPMEMLSHKPLAEELGGRLIQAFRSKVPFCTHK